MSISTILTVLSLALCGKVKEQPVEVTGEVSSDGRNPEELSACPGSDGDGVERLTVCQPKTAFVMEQGWHQ